MITLIYKNYLRNLIYISCLFKTTLANEEDKEDTIPNMGSFALT